MEWRNKKPQLEPVFDFFRRFLFRKLWFIKSFSFLSVFKAARLGRRMWYRWNGAGKEEVTCWSSISCAECVAYSFALGFNLETLSSIPEFSSLLSLFGLIWISIDLGVFSFSTNSILISAQDGGKLFSNFDKHVSQQISSFFASSAFCHTFGPSLRCRHQEWSFIFSSTAVLTNPIGYFTSLLRHPLECLSPDFAQLRLDFAGTFAVITLEIDQSSIWSILQSDFS